MKRRHLRQGTSISKVRLLEMVVVSKVGGVLEHHI